MLFKGFTPIVFRNRNLCQGKVRNYVSDYIKVKDNTLTCVDGFSEVRYICAFGKKITEFMPSLNEEFTIITELVAGSASFTVSEKETLLLNIAEMEFSDWTIELIALLVEERVEPFKDYEEKEIESKVYSADFLRLFDSLFQDMVQKLKDIVVLPDKESD